MPNQTTRTVLVATAADLGVALAKVGTAVFTGSTAMAATAAESLADTGNDLFLLMAQHRSRRRPDDQHALGYGREAYFWALLAGLGVLVGGAVFSLREGIEELIRPSVTSSFTVAYVVLAISAGFDLMSVRQSAGQMARRARLAGRKLVKESAETSDPALRTVFLTDTVSVAGDLITVAALVLNQVTGSSISQAVAAVLIGLALIAIGYLLVRRSHDFLVGAWRSGDIPHDAPHFTRAFRRDWEERGRAFLLGYPGVTGIHELILTFVGPAQVWIVARVHIDDGLSGAQVESLVRGLESSMKQLEYIYRADVVPMGAAGAVDTRLKSSL